MAFSAYSARNAKVTFNGAVFTARRWTVSFEGDSLETTNFESGGYHENITGIRTLTFTIEADDNGTATVTDAITVGLYSAAGALRLYCNSPQAVFWSIPTPFIKSVSYNADVKDKMTVTIQGNGSGTFTQPTGAPGSTT